MGIYTLPRVRLRGTQRLSQASSLADRSLAEDRSTECVRRPPRKTTIRQIPGEFKLEQSSGSRDEGKGGCAGRGGSCRLLRRTWDSPRVLSKCRWDEKWSSKPCGKI